EPRHGRRAGRPGPDPAQRLLQHHAFRAGSRTVCPRTTAAVHRRRTDQSVDVSRGTVRSDRAGRRARAGHGGWLRMRETRTGPHVVRGAVVLAGVVLLVAATLIALNSPRLSLQALPLGMDTGEGSTDVEMRFERADRLAPGAEVRYGERLVGRVRTVD